MNFVNIPQFTIFRGVENERFIIFFSGDEIKRHILYTRHWNPADLDQVKSYIDTLSLSLSLKSEDTPADDDQDFQAKALYTTLEFVFMNCINKT